MNNEKGLQVGAFDEDGMYDNFNLATPLKHSKNIIDLLEVGDVIKFQELAMEEKYGTIVNQIYISDIHDNDELIFIKEEIERKGIKLISILTKEQFSQAEYKIKEDK